MNNKNCSVIVQLYFAFACMLLIYKNLLYIRFVPIIICKATDKVYFCTAKSVR